MRVRPEERGILGTMNVRSLVRFSGGTSCCNMLIRAVLLMVFIFLLCDLNFIYIDQVGTWQVVSMIAVAIVNVLGLCTLVWVGFLYRFLTKELIGEFTLLDIYRYFFLAFYLVLDLGGNIWYFADPQSYIHNFCGDLLDPRGGCHYRLQRNPDGETNVRFWFSFVLQFIFAFWAFFLLRWYAKNEYALILSAKLIQSQLNTKPNPTSMNPVDLEAADLDVNSGADRPATIKSESGEETDMKAEIAPLEENKNDKIEKTHSFGDEFPTIKYDSATDLHNYPTEKEI